MALFEFKLPDIGEGVAEGEIVEWHVKVGDEVREDDPMIEVMTDKATVTIGAPKDGTIAELKVTVGAMAKVGDVLVTITLAGGTADSDDAPTIPPAPAHAPGGTQTLPKPPPPAALASPGSAGLAGVASGGAAHGPDSVSPSGALPSPVGVASSGASAGPAGVSPRGASAATAVGDIREELPGADHFKRPAAPTNGGGGTRSGYFNERPLATPATRKLARDLDVDLRRVAPSGAAGRVTKDDVQSFVRGGASPVAESPVSKITSPTAVMMASPALAAADGGALEERKPFVGIRRKIAQRMQHAKNTAAHFTFVEECDVARLVELRRRLKPSAERRGVHLSFLPFIVRAVTGALKRHPVLNSALDEATNELVFKRYYHMGVAAATDQGLMVPVVRDADQRSLLDLAVEIQRLGDGARAGTLTAQELSGSTFTITSLGKQGGLFATPILNFPEVAILGVHQMKKRPVVQDGQIAIGEVMLLSLSFDHRIVDGHVGAAFAYDVIALLEDPESMFLDMA